ncbi:MAG: SpoIIE family protein phosphatase [Acidobacteriia bacterium]|nr:SpoIIE family protein phosphatase [Terriglobia bacterium]
MATTEHTYLRGELEKRRERLQSAVHSAQRDASLSQLLTDVDAALARMDHDTFGICESCKGTVDSERLLADPLCRVCLSCLSKDEQRALEHDLTLAGNIQRALLPGKDFAAAGWQIRYHYEPAGPVSGDYCDLIATPGGLLFLLGDVSGKGVAASMLMSHLHATFRSLAGANLPLERMVEAANRIFCESTLASHFATLVVGRALSDGAVEFVSAGHPPILHLHADGVTPLAASSVPLGMFCDTRFPVQRLSLRESESLFLYTDGLSERENHLGQEYGLERITQLVAKRAASAPEQVLAECLRDLRSHATGRKPDDDLTLLMLRRTA